FRRARLRYCRDGQSCDVLLNWVPTRWMRFAVMPVLGGSGIIARLRGYPAARPQLRNNSWRAICTERAAPEHSAQQSTLVITGDANRYSHHKLAGVVIASARPRS